MKKLLSSILALSATVFMVVFRSTPIIQAQAALSTPEGVEWSYKSYEVLGSYIWQTRDYTTSTYYDGPMYTRFSNGSFNDYATSFDDTLGLPQGLSLEIRFNKSTTPWADDYGAFYPYGPYIGSNNTTGATVKKMSITIDNQSSHDYRFYFDASSSASGFTVYWYTPQMSWDYNSNYYHTNLFPMVIKSYSKISIYQATTSNQSYFDAIYLDDLGLSSAYTNGYTNGDYDGQVEGYENGYEVGYNDGEDDGYEVGYDDGFIVGNDEGQATIGLFSVLAGAVSAVTGIFSLEIFPNLTLGSLILIPLVISIFVFFKKMSRSN